MFTARVNNVTIDCLDPSRLARFYSELLHRKVVFEEGPWVVVGRDRDRPGEPNLVFQRVADPTPGKSKAHVDIHTDDVDAACEWAVSLGATRGEDVEELGMRWRVMADPEGNPFCLAPD